MTKREIVFMCCRLMAVWLFMNSLFLLSQTLSSNYYSGMSIAGSGTSMGTSLSINFNGVPATPLQLTIFLGFKILPVLLEWLAATGLWAWSREISVRMFESVTEDIETGQQFKIGSDVRAVAFGCLGLFFLVEDIPIVITRLLFWSWNYLSWGRVVTPPIYDYFSWAIIVRIPLSLWLLFGLRGLAGLWRMAQEKGIAPTR